MESLASTAIPAIIFAGIVLFIFYLYVRLWFTWLINKFRKKVPRKILTDRYAICMHIIAVIGTLCIIYGIFIEPYWPKVNFIPIQTDKLTDTTFRVVQISDTHCDKILRLEKRLPEIINNLKPDIIVFTGDSLNSKSALSRFQGMLARMEAPLGKFAVTGNWDIDYGADLDLFENTGFEELISDLKAVKKNGESIIVSGLAYENGPKSYDVVGKLAQSDFNLFLYHTSDLMDYLGEIPIDLYLSGHTHGGQVALPFYGAIITFSSHGKKFEAGLYRENHIQLYVNRGIGMERKAPFRFLARPEIAVFDIGPAILIETKE